MNKIILSALALLVMTASAFTLRNGSAAPAIPGNPELTTNGAFRDGVYTGKLAGESGDQYHVATARWATGYDRVRFAAGYDQGYKAQLALRAAK
ncbi:MAG: hypothetical protein JWN74_278 [Acidobacteriaceae bacterium]|nr:hypothetical protein [Acidobacteriaceae bacterium]